MAGRGTADFRPRRRVFLLRALAGFEGAVLAVLALVAAAYLLTADRSTPEQGVWAAGMTYERAPGDHNSVPAGRTIYVVSSEAEAALLRQGIEEGNNLRHSLGLSPLREEVVVAPTREHVAEMIAALGEGNYILGGFSVEDRIVNLAG